MTESDAVAMVSNTTPSYQISCHQLTSSHQISCNQLTSSHQISCNQLDLGRTDSGSPISSQVLLITHFIFHFHFSFAF